jgi:protein-tyrosine phosphatase
MRILFICTGNMTRSPLAEAVLRKKLKESGSKGIEVISAGTGATDGLDRDAMMLEVAAERGYDVSGKTKRVDYFSGIEADLILCMEPHHVDYMKGILPAYFHTRIHLLMRYALDSAGVIYDPTCCPKDFYHSVLDTIEAACDGIIAKTSGTQMN